MSHTILALAALLAASPPWEGLLPRRAIGAEELQRAHPTWDGRGVVIAVLDTGVDMGAPGLRSLPDGTPKVVGVRDASGQGKVRLGKARLVEQEGLPTLRAGDRFVRGASALRPPPLDGTLRLGELREDAMAGSSVADLNADGDKDDVFSIVVWEAQGSAGTERWAVMDTDGDRDVADEPPLRSYEVSQQAFTLKGYDPSRRAAPLTMGLYLAPGLDEAEVHFDDGGHGTHCAGIAAGHAIDGKEGYHGIAPGALVLSIKIGDNGLSGGSTTTGAKKRAMQIAADWAEDHGVPVVINLSYGIGTETEGASDIDRLVDDTLAKHPLLFISTSNGNNGPGISTAGQPSGSAVAFTAGAALVRESARALYGLKLDQDRVFWFSSRGGELNKPDGVLPGIAGSAVPPWMQGNVMRGTSMAAPQAAGAMAVILSAMAEKGVTVHQGIVRRALRYAGRPLPGYTALDQGGGLVDLPAAVALAERLAQSDEAQRVLAWRAKTTCPTCGGEGPGAYWRAGGFVPPERELLTATLTPILSAPEGTTKARRQELVAAFDVTSDVPWLQVRSGTVYARGDGAVTVRYSLRPDRLEEPGLHVGRLRGVADGAPAPAFELLATVVTPHVFERGNQWSKSFSGSLSPGELDRTFLLVPSAASTLFLDLKLTKGANVVAAHVYTPEGRLHTSDDATAARTGRLSLRVDQADLRPGIWEVVLVAPERNPEAISWALDARFTGLQADPVRIFTVPQGAPPEAMAEVTNRLPRPFRGHATGVIRGVSRKQLHDAAGDTLELPLRLDAETAGVELDLTLEREEYARFTDVAIAIKDSGGNPVVKGGFSQAHTKVVANLPPGTYTLVIQAAGTEDAVETWSVDIEELYLHRQPLPVTAELDGSTTFTLWPDVPATLDLTLSRTPVQAPDGMVHHGALELVSDEDEKTWLSIPLRLSP
ncbi:MAG: serine protease [Myxococcales bacterium]